MIFASKASVNAVLVPIAYFGVAEIFFCCFLAVDTCRMSLEIRFSFECLLAPTAMMLTISLA